MAYLYSDKLADAKAALAKVSEKDADYQNAMGVVALREGNYAEAAKCFNASGNESAKENLAVLDILNGKYADAAAKLANSDCCGNKALAYILTGQLDKASAAIKCACPTSSYLKAVICCKGKPGESRKRCKTRRKGSQGYRVRTVQVKTSAQ